MRGVPRGVLLLSLLAGCGGDRLTGPVPATKSRVFALSSGRTGPTGNANRALTLIDRSSWRIIRTVPIGGQGDAFLSLDPSGRAWVVHHGTVSVPERTLEVFSPTGDKLAEVQTCALGHRAVFVAGSAWVACEENLFVGALARVRLDDLSSQGSLGLSFPESDAFTVSASGIVGDTVAVAGYINDGAGVLFIDPLPFGIANQTKLGHAVSVSSVVPRGAKALLLNVLSGLANGTPDVIQLADPASPPSDLTIFPSPSVGAVAGDALYVYALPSTAPGDSSTIARRSLTTGALSHWQVALTGIVGQMAADDAAVFLAHDDTTSDIADGIYEVDPTSGALSERLSLPDVSNLALAGP